MSKLVIKTGMKNEYDIAKAHAANDVLVLTGIQKVEDLEKLCGDDCEFIISFGMCGGIGPGPVVGQTILASYLLGPDGAIYIPNKTWNHILKNQTGAQFVPWLSTGQFNQSNTPEQRKALYNTTGALAMDDETLFVAQFAEKKKIRWTVCRNVSDAYQDNVAIASNLLNAAGNVDVWNVIKAFATDPKDMIKLWENYNISNKGLGITGIQLGPYFGTPLNGLFSNWYNEWDI